MQTPPRPDILGMGNRGDEMRRGRFNISGVSLAVVVSSGCVCAAIGPDATASFLIIFIVLLSVVLFGLRHPSPSLARRLVRALVFSVIALMLCAVIFKGQIYMLQVLLASVMFICAFPLYLSL